MSDVEHVIITDGGEEYFDDELALAQLLLDGVLFCNSREITYNGKPEGFNVVLFVLCNDVFAWALADGESIDTSEIEALYRMHMADKKWGSTKWCCKKRGMQPQFPVARDMKKDGAWDESLDALKPNAYDEACRTWSEKQKEKK